MESGSATCASEPLFTFHLPFVGALGQVLLVHGTQWCRLKSLLKFSSDPVIEITEDSETVQGEPFVDPVDDCSFLSDDRGESAGCTDCACEINFRSNAANHTFDEGYIAED